MKTFFLYSIWCLRPFPLSIHFDTPLLVLMTVSHIAIPPILGIQYWGYISKLLLEAIRTLPEEKRTAILLYYFEGMTDVEIGKMFNTSRSTIQYRRTSSFELLKKYLEGHADEWEEW